MSTPSVLVSGAVEGIVDDAVVRRLLIEAETQPGPIHIAGDKPSLRQRIRAYNHAAAQCPWFVLVDLDRQHPCAAALRKLWLPQPARLMRFRIAVQEVESWLLADRQSIAQFLGVGLAKIPGDTDSLQDPKQALINLARRSRRREIREDVVPRPDSGRTEGPAYASRMIEYSQAHWRPSVAVDRSDSLRRCCQALRTLIDECRM